MPTALEFEPFAGDERDTAPSSSQTPSGPPSWDGAPSTGQTASGPPAWDGAPSTGKTPPSATPAVLSPTDLPPLWEDRFAATVTGWTYAWGSGGSALIEWNASEHLDMTVSVWGTGVLTLKAPGAAGHGVMDEGVYVIRARVKADADFTLLGGSIRDGSLDTVLGSVTLATPVELTSEWQDIELLIDITGTVGATVKRACLDFGGPDTGVISVDTVQLYEFSAVQKAWEPSPSSGQTAPKTTFDAAPSSAQTAPQTSFDAAPSAAQTPDSPSWTTNEPLRLTHEAEELTDFTGETVVTDSDGTPVGFTQ